MAYKQQPKSPMLKALKGNQGKLPQHLKDAIKAAPESPAKQTKKAHTDEMGRKGHFNPTTARTKGDRLNSRSDTESTYPNKYQNAIVKPSSRERGYAKKVGYQEDNMRRTHKYDTIISGRANAYTVKENNFGIKKPKASIKSPAKQTTAGEFAHKKSIKDKEMGKSTKVVDKLTSALEAPFSDKTYSELKKEKRAKQKAKYNAKSPAKQTKKKTSITGKKRVPPAPRVPVGPRAEKPKTKKDVFIERVNKKRYK